MELPDFGTILAWLGSAGALAVIGNVLIQRMRGSTEIEGKHLDLGGNLRKSTDEVALKLLAAADDRIAHWQSENLRLTIQLTQVERELREAREAIEYLRQILFAENDGERTIIEDRARAFLNMLNSQTSGAAD